MNKDVVINVDNLQPVLDEAAEKLDGLRLSVCSRCGHYPKLVFNEGRNCSTGLCFRRFVREQIAAAKEAEDAGDDA